MRAVGHEDLGGARRGRGLRARAASAWSLAEYLLHRFVFHFEPDTRWGRRLHFIIHGVHHDYPARPDAARDAAVGEHAARDRCSSSGSARCSGPRGRCPFFAGFLVGYLIYDMTHYHMHHHRSKNRLSLALRRYHYRHHFQQSDRGFGVTSPLWDRVFRTVPAPAPPLGLAASRSRQQLSARARGRRAC